MVNDKIMTIEYSLRDVIKNVVNSANKKKNAKAVTNKHISIDEVMEQSSYNAMNAIYNYINTETNNEEEKIRSIITIDYMLGIIPEDNYGITIPQVQIASMNNSIIKQLNRSSQLLSSKLVEEVEIPNDIKKFEKLIKKTDNFEQYRSIDTLLFASNMIMLTNSLDTNLFKQVASTLYDKYDLKTDKNKITVQKLKEQLKVEYRDIYEKLFENGLEEYKSILMPLRNIVGHSDISQKIVAPLGRNPKIMYDGKEQDAYPLIQKITLAYLEKTNQLYQALSKQIQTDGKKPYISKYIEDYKQKYNAKS